MPNSNVTKNADTNAQTQVRRRKMRRMRGFEPYWNVSRKTRKFFRHLPNRLEETKTLRNDPRSWNVCVDWAPLIVWRKRISRGHWHVNFLPARKLCSMDILRDTPRVRRVPRNVRARLWRETRKKEREFDWVVLGWLRIGKNVGSVHTLPLRLMNVMRPEVYVTFEREAREYFYHIPQILRFRVRENWINTFF